MKLIQLLVSAAIVATLPFKAQAGSAENKTLVLDALKNTLLAGDVKAVDRYFAKDIIQHNEMFANGIDAQKSVVGFLAGNVSSKVEHVRVIADDELVAVHARYEGFGDRPMVGFDVFRVEDGKIVEHWGNLIEEQPLTRSDRCQIDGPTEISDIDQTEANKALVAGFMTCVLINREQVDFTQFINPANYAQHNPVVATCSTALTPSWPSWAQRGRVTWKPWAI